MILWLIATIVCLSSIAGGKSSKTPLSAGPQQRRRGEGKTVLFPGRNPVDGWDGSPYLDPNRTVTCPSRYSSMGYMSCGGPPNRCGPNGECICGAGFRGSRCEYQQRSRKTAFTLSFLLGNWGAGLLYIGMIGMGITKMMVIMMLMIAPCIPMCCMCVSYESRKLRLYYQCVVVLSAIAMTLIMGWWVWDWLYLLQPTTKDYLGWDLLPDL